MFTTSRLYRKVYQSLAFVEEEIVDRGKRAVFVRSGPLDTDETDHWRQLLQMYALIDEFVVADDGRTCPCAHRGSCSSAESSARWTYRRLPARKIPNVVTRIGKQRPPPG